MADAYLAGTWECDDLVTLVRIGAREIPRLDTLRRALLPLRRGLPRNTITGARRHIAAHYDLGNELFAAFLDETMTYSCAAFDSPAMTLREAQEAKFERVCRGLELGLEDHLVEIGSGWGGLAVHAAMRHGCRVTTISREQRGRYSKLVSIEMIEAVGWQYFDTYFHRCAGLLEPGGRMALQAITIDDRYGELEMAARSFANTHVFPSGCLPSLSVIRHSAGRAGLVELEREDLSDSYPLTLRRRRENFAAAWDRVAELGYDERFRRRWELYLSWCEGGFVERRIKNHLLSLAARG